MILRPVCWLGLACLTGEIIAWLMPCAYLRAAGLVLGLVILWLAGMCGLRVSALRKRLPQKAWRQLSSIADRRSAAVLLVCILFLGIGYGNYSRAYAAACDSDEMLAAGESSGTWQGTVTWIEEKTNSWYIYVRQCTLVPGCTIVVSVSKDTQEDIYTVAACGDRLTFTGSISLFSHPSNWGEFDEWMYYQARGIRAKVYADELTVTGTSAVSAGRLRQAILLYMKENISCCLTKTYSGVVYGIVSGDKSLLDADLKELYQLAGISHILAISGLHISFIGTGTCRLLRRLGLRLQVCVMAGITLMLLYGGLTGMAVSTLRAVVMSGMALFARFCGRTCSREISLCTALLVLLISSPLMLTQPGFLLSFSAAAGLLLCPADKHASNKKERWQKKRSAAAGETGSDKGPAVVRGIRRIVEIVQAPVLITVGMLPAMAWCFYEITPYSFLLNLIVIPLMSFLFPAALLCGLCGDAAGPCGRLLVWCIELVLSFYELLCRMVLRLPYAVIVIGRPAVREMMLACGLLTAAAWLFTRKGLSAAVMRMAAVTAGVLLLVLPSVPAGLTVTMFDVGQGDCFLLRLPTGENILIDAGSSDETSLWTYMLEPCLKALGVGQLDAVFVSHMDSDHISGISELLQDSIWESADQTVWAPGSIQIRMLFMSWNVADFGDYETLVSLAEQLSVPCYGLKTADTVAVGDLRLIVISPSADTLAADSNDDSLVLAGVYGAFDMVFTGDISTEMEEEVIQAMTALGITHCDLYKVAHHGSRYSSSQELLEFLSPIWAFISCGADNSYGHPHEELLQRLQSIGAEVYVTADNGQTTLFTDGKTARVAVWSWDRGYHSNHGEVALEE